MWVFFEIKWSLNKVGIPLILWKPFTVLKCHLSNIDSYVPLLAGALQRCTVFWRYTNCWQCRRARFKFKMQLTQELPCASDVCRIEWWYRTFHKITHLKSPGVRVFAEKQTIVEYEDLRTRSVAWFSPYKWTRHSTGQEVKLVNYCQLIVSKCQLTFCATHPITKSRYVVTNTCAPSDVTQLIFL